jgi:hypothetical protein
MKGRNMCLYLERSGGINLIKKYENFGLHVSFAMSVCLYTSVRTEVPEDRWIYYHEVWF